MKNILGGNLFSLNLMCKVKYVIFVFILLQTSCVSKQKKDDVLVEDILLEIPYDIDLEEAVNSPVVSVKLSEVAKDISYIPLETSNSSILKRIYQYVFYNKTLLVTDMNNFCQFDHKGNFVKKIGKKGSGPEDYNYITSIVKNNPSSELYLFTRGKINVYNEFMDFIHSVSLREQGLSTYNGLITPSNELLMYLGYTFKLIEDTTTIYSLARLDTSGNIINKIPNRFPLESTFPGMILGEVPLYRYGNFIRFMDYGSDTLYTISSQNEMIPLAICHLGEMKREINTVRYNQQQWDSLASKLLITNICEDDRFLYITLEWGVTEIYQYVLFDKRTGGLRNLGSIGLINDIDGGLSFFPKRIELDGSMIMWMSAEHFIEGADILPIEDQNHILGKNFESIESIASKIKVDDNDIFIIAK